MKRISFLPLLFIVLFSTCSRQRSGDPVVLVFYKTAGFYHNSIPTGIEAIRNLGAANHFGIDTTRNAAYFNDDSLKKYSAVIFLNTTGDVLDYRQEAALERYIQAGGGYVGIHSATDTEYDWGWYGDLSGARFNGHPHIQEAVFHVSASTGPGLSFPDSLWKHTNEIYNYRNLAEDLKVLLDVQESSYTGGTNGNFHPISWYHDFDGGRAFYTGLGHTIESYSDSVFLKHMLGGIQYAIGNNEEPDYKKAKSQYPPDEDRFVKTQLALAGDFFEPTEMTIFSNLDILIIQRRGDFLFYKQDSGKVYPAGHLDVYFKSSKGVNVEEGLLGLAKDPDFDKNHFIYVYYSPVDTAVNRLSRFVFENNQLQNNTEKTILEVKSQRDICCHTGGSIAFGPDGLLYLSTGDNSTPFDEAGQRYVNSGFGPLNDNPGHEPYDARRSSANANDLRGKILRIRVQPDGTYSIPDGNLFPVGTEKTRPEIYVMGNRNPYRISVDQKNSNLYWGEVGPDAANDSLATRGPRGYDELNQARKAGFFGWPMFVGNNYPYHEYDYNTGKSGPLFDAAHPVNTSRNNTGITELPPVSPAFIWYPYGPSNEFPQVGTGGRNAMAGPVYYTDMFPQHTRLPDYYNGKVIIYEWIRGWMKAVTLKPNGDFYRLEPFAPGIRVNSLIDMEVGPDGRLYLLEYGSGWFTKNKDAGLARIDYIGSNRPPVLKSATANVTSGPTPLTVEFRADATDPENDQLTFSWRTGDGQTVRSKQHNVSYTYEKPGVYTAEVVAEDHQSDSRGSLQITIVAGNSRPVVTVKQTSGNTSFAMPGHPVGYSITVEDEGKAVTDSQLAFVAARSADNQNRLTEGHQQVAEGRALVFGQDCKSCHKENEKSIGPSFADVAKKYQHAPDKFSYLANKIIQGGSGVWGDVAMAAHPTLDPKQVDIMVAWILSLATATESHQSLPLEGTYSPANQTSGKSLVISASYTDQGNGSGQALTGNGFLFLPGNRVTITGNEKASGFGAEMNGSYRQLRIPASGGWVQVPAVDLTGVKFIHLHVLVADKAPGKIPFEIRTDSENGTVLGKGVISRSSGKTDNMIISVALSGTTGSHSLYLVCGSADKDPGKLLLRELEFSAN